jgi:hypothetical protein
MVVDRNGLPWDRAAEEGAQEWIQWLHPGEESRRRQDEAPLIGARVYRVEMTQPCSTLLYAAVSRAH